MISRREFLLAGCAAGMSPKLAFGQGSTGPQTQTLKPGAISMDHPDLAQPWQNMLGFNGSVPGPEIRLRQGEELRVRLQNGMEDGAAVHWHGVRVPNHMDGVPVLTQNPVPPGAHFDYKFRPPDAGTYWYHSHYVSHEQVGRGLFGALIVEETQPPDVDRDITVFLADFRTGATGAFDPDFVVPSDFSTEGRIGERVLAFCSQRHVNVGERVRLRFINAAIDRVFDFKLSGGIGAVVAIDGMPLPSPEALAPMVLAPAQRVDVILDVTEGIRLDVLMAGVWKTVGRLSASGESRREARAEIAALQPNDLPMPGRILKHVDILLRGGEGDLDHGGFGSWSINGVSGLPRAPVAGFRRESTGVLTLSNPTAFPHAIHLHGHHFREVLADQAYGPLRDTLLVGPHETRPIVCVFDNPGRWLLHCHMLSHSADGMVTWIEVS